MFAFVLSVVFFCFLTKHPFILLLSYALPTHIYRYSSLKPKFMMKSMSANMLLGNTKKKKKKKKKTKSYDGDAHDYLKRKSTRSNGTDVKKIDLKSRLYMVL